MCIRTISQCSNCVLHAICFSIGGGELLLVSKLNVRHGVLARGEPLYHAGQRSAAFYSLRSGCVKDVLNERMGTESVVQFSLPGEAVGMGCFAKTRTQTTAVAVTATQYCRVLLTSVQRLANEVPEIGRELLRLLAVTMIATQQRVVVMFERDALTRVAGFLLDMSERLQRAGLDGSRFSLGLSRRDIASYLGMTLETSSRCLTELHERRLIEVRAKQLWLLRPAELKLIGN